MTIKITRRESLRHKLATNEVKLLLGTSPSPNKAGQNPLVARTAPLPLSHQLLSEAKATQNWAKEIVV